VCVLGVGGVGDVNKISSTSMVVSSPFSH
jgi:hypothetical protein